MTSNYSEIFSIMLSKCEAYDFVDISELQFEEIMTEYLNVGISMAHVRNLFVSIKRNDEEQMLDWELKNSIDDVTDKYFVNTVLAKAILVQWIEKHVNTQTLIKQMLGTSKEKFYSQSNLLNSLMSLRKETERSLRYDIKAHGYLNTTL